MNKQATIGAVTFKTGISLLPESVLVDRKGIIRYHFVNNRDWSSPEAARCVKTFAAQK